MSAGHLSEALSLKSIASQYALPVIVQPTLGFRGSSRSFIFYSILKVDFAFGRALKVHRSKRNDYHFFKPIDSELLAIPLQYPGYFECLLPSSYEIEDVVQPEKTIQPIVERMQSNFRSQMFYIASPMRVYTLEIKPDKTQNRLWHRIEAHQLITLEQLISIEYTPIEDDNLTSNDYAYPWWLCFFKQILNRTERVLKCILSDQQICYIPCSSTDEICLYPVAQHGSTNVYKLHTINNLLEQFPLPTNIKLTKFPNSHAYKDFNGRIRLLDSHTKEFAVCGSLKSTNVCLIPLNNSLTFRIKSIPLTSVEINNQLTCCQIFVQSFNNQICRILLSTHDTSCRSRSRSQSSMNGKPNQLKSTEDIHHSQLSLERKRNASRRSRAISASSENSTSRQPFKRALSTEDNSIYDSLVHPVQTKHLLKQTSSTSPSPSSPNKSLNTTQSFTYDTGSNLINDIDLPNANGSILIDNINELFSSKQSRNRISGMTSIERKAH